MLSSLPSLHALRRFRLTRSFWRFRVAGALLVAVLLTACGSASGSQATAPGDAAPAQAPEGGAAGVDAYQERVFTDELAHQVVISKPPVKIFAPYLEDALLSLGVKPVAQWSNGEQSHQYLQDELAGIPTLDFSGGPPSSEVLLSHDPDLIILHTANYAGNGVYENYAKIAPTYVFNNASGNMEQTLETLGKLLGKEREAEQALQAYRQKVEQAKAAIGQTVAGKKVAIIRFARKGVSLMGGNYFCGYVIQRHLGIAMTKLTENENSLNVSMEILPELDADYIFVIDAYGQGAEKMKEMMESPIWKSIPAVKQGHVYEADDAYWLGSGLIAYGKIIDDVVKVVKP